MASGALELGHASLTDGSFHAGVVNAQLGSDGADSPVVDKVVVQNIGALLFTDSHAVLLLINIARSGGARGECVAESRSVEKN